MLGREATGVATYARAMEAALRSIRPELLRVVDPSCGRPMGRAARSERWLRWADALLDRRRSLRHTADALAARDIFRLAQVHFDRHGTMLRLQAPGAPGIVHWTYPLPIRIEGWANIYTVHDAIPLTHPELSEIEPRRHRRLLAALAGSAERLITVSDAARTDIVAALGCDPALVRSCPPGLPRAEARAQPPAGLAPNGYFLFVGTIEPRKNLLRLVEAYRQSGASLPLVIVGPDGWRAAEISPDIEAVRGVIRMAYADRATIVDLIAHARALLLPSIVEGFGLPIIEAMQLGTAVLTAHGGATEEVSGGAALLADPLSVTELATRIARLAEDDALVAALSRAGRANAASYTLDAFATRLEAIEDELLQSLPLGAP